MLKKGSTETRCIKYDMSNEPSTVLSASFAIIKAQREARIELKSTHFTYRNNIMFKMLASSSQSMQHHHSSHRSCSMMSDEYTGDCGWTGTHTIGM